MKKTMRESRGSHPRLAEAAASPQVKPCRRKLPSKLRTKERATKLAEPIKSLLLPNRSNYYKIIQLKAFAMFSNINSE